MREANSQLVAESRNGFRLPAPTGDEILNLLPQKSPFRFVDRILEVSPDRIVGEYRFTGGEFFYAGHFPEFPITPGVILLECMCQIGIVAHGIYLLAQELNHPGWRDDAKRWTTFFSDAECEFLKPVLPGSLVRVEAEKVYWRKRKLKSKVSMFVDGECVAVATPSGIGIQNEFKK